MSWDGSVTTRVTEADFLVMSHRNLPGKPGAMSHTNPTNHIAGRLALITIAADLIAIVVAFGLAILIADGLRVLFGHAHISFFSFLDVRAVEMAMLGALTIAIFSFGGLYRRGGWELDEIRRIVLGVALVALFDTALQYIQNDHSSRLWFLIAYPLVAILIITMRMALRAMPAVSEAMTTHVVMFGNGMTPEQLTYEMRESRSGSIRFLDTHALSDLDVHDARALLRLLERAGADAGVPTNRVQVMVAPGVDELSMAQELVELLNAIGQNYSILLPFQGLARSGIGLQKMVGADVVMAEVNQVTPPALMQSAKRVFDIVVAGLLIVAILPVFLILTLLLLREGGSVFFSQLRVGHNGRRFRCLKFRTMLPDAEERLQELLNTDPAARAEWERYQKLTNDPRITAVGHFLRKTSLDELPQLINVLKGEMSLVGPRPIIAPEVEGYPGDRAYYDSPRFAYYMQCTPGITGLWQVSGRASTSHDERVRLDGWYARNMSFWLDLMILFKTFKAVLARRGSS